MSDMSDKISKFLSENGIDFQESSRSFITDCPKCNKRKLYFSKDDGYFTCFHCADDGVKGKSPFYGLSLLTGLTKDDIKSKFEFNDFPEEIVVKVKQEYNKPVYIPKRFISISHPDAKLGSEYILKRGVSLTVAEIYNIKYDPEKKQVIFLVMDGDKIIGYQGRSVDPNCPKAESKYTSPGFQKSKNFIFQSNVRGDSVIIAEGPFSAIKFAKTGVSFVASMGKNISSGQIEKLKSLDIKRIYLALDPDAVKEMNSFLTKYRSLFEIYYIVTPQNKEDFGACTFDECILAYRRAQQLIYPIEVDPLSFDWI